MNVIARPVWVATLAKMVSPMEAEHAAKGIAAMMPMLTFPDEVFTFESVREVCSTGRIYEPGVYGPLTRVPTFGELESALGRWWWRQRDRMAVKAAPVARERLPAPESYDASAETAEAARSALEAKEQVSALVRSYVAERSFNQTQMSPTATRAVPRHMCDEHLLVKYNQLADEGAPGAALRVTMLEKKLGPKMSKAAREMATKLSAIPDPKDKSAKRRSYNAP